MLNQVRVCLVGAGRVAKVHAYSLTQHVPQGKLVAVVDVDRAALNALSDQFGVEKRFPTLEEALESEEFDAVVITTPTFTHSALAIMAARGGKHILLEKPMALSLEDCDAIQEAVKSHRVLLQLAFMRRFDPDFIAAAERIAAGEIGQPMMIKSLTHGPGLPPPWARDLKTSNGNLAEVNSHDWDCVRWLMRSNFHRVYVETANFKGKDAGITSENYYDNALVSLRFESGALGSISSICPCNYGYDARVEVVGEKGIMLIGGLQNQSIVLCTDRKQGLITPIHPTWARRFERGYIGEMKHFIECIQTGSEPKVGGEDGRWAVAGVLAANRSFLEGRAVFLEEIMI